MTGTPQASPVPSFQLMSRPGREGTRKTWDRVSLGAGKAVRRVAVVEDELMVALTIESMLEDLGHQVVGIFANGEDAIAALRDVSVDLVCMDINLGRGIDGIEAARQIRETQATDVLFITAYSDSAIKTRILETVPDAVMIGKPTSLIGLEQAIRNFDGAAN